MILCQRVFIPDEFSHVGLVEHYYGQGINSPTILRGLCCHTKTLRREIVMEKKKKLHKEHFVLIHWTTEVLWLFCAKIQHAGAATIRRPVQCVRNKHRKWANVLVRGPCSVLVGETHQGHIRHGVDHHSLVLHCVLSDSPEAWFQHVVPVEEGLLCSRFHPHLKLNNDKKNLF